jgi:hypothetical protein
LSWTPWTKLHGKARLSERAGARQLTLRKLAAQTKLCGCGVKYAS